MAYTRQQSFPLVEIHLPVRLTFAGLVIGLGLGALLADSAVIATLLAISEPIGTLWLRALQMTIIPLVASLLVLGIAQMAQAARAGAAARRMILLVIIVLTTGTAFTAIALPQLLVQFPIPGSASGMLAKAHEAQQQLPDIADFFTGLIASNVIEAAANTAMLPLTIFFALFALALTRLPGEQSERLLGLFHSLGNAMLIMIGWVLWLAPIGVAALAMGVAARAGGGAFAALVHYILVVSAMGGFVFLGAYFLAWVLGKKSPLEFARAMIPAQAVALSTQSSLASLPAMLDSASRLKLRQDTAEFVLPLAVAIFRATSPAMNLAVAIYCAHLAGIELSPHVLVAGGAVALVISLGTVSLPGTISFVFSVGPIAMAMGAPIEALALLVAVEMLPDLMRTIGNVTMNVAVTCAVDRVKAD